MSARTLPSGQEEVDQYGDSSTGLHRTCGDHLAGMRAMRTPPARGRRSAAKSRVSRCTWTHGRRGPQGHSSASHRRPETHHGLAGVRDGGAQRRCEMAAIPAHRRRKPDTHASRAEVGRELGGGPGTDPLSGAERENSGGVTGGSGLWSRGLSGGHCCSGYGCRRPGRPLLRAFVRPGAFGSFSSA